MKKSFRYWSDPLCLGTCALYAMNRWILKPHCASPFLHSYFNDLLLIPAALPLVLWLQRRFGLRTNDSYPTLAEVLFHVAVWAPICEIIGPRFKTAAVADPLDMAAYFFGGLLAWLCWRLMSRMEMVLS